MDIGKKIKEIRTEKLMTQSQLAGDEITRNMLSRIENGAALPSLGTVMYLAKRLGVPAGVLLSDDDCEYNFKKDSLIKKIKDSFAACEYALCLDMCIEGASDADDEIYYIATLCSVRLAEENMIEGELYEARTLLERAIEFSEKTIYDTVCARAQAYVLLDFLRSLSPMLDLDTSDIEGSEARMRNLSCASPLCRYINMLLETDRGDYDRVDGYLAEERDCDDRYSQLYVGHIEARLKMKDGEYLTARDSLRSILDLDDMALKLMIYIISKDIEICCRETGDYKGAYEFSETKLGLIESMLRGGL